MGWLRKKDDPISERAKALNEQIASLESRIKQLSTQAEPEAGNPQPPPVAASRETVFEKMEQRPLQAPTEAGITPDHYNDLGVRKYDLMAMVRRLFRQFKGPETSNPKLVNYLAVGSIQGLRPLRYEKRVARNRFIFLVLCFVLVLWGILAAYLKGR